MIINAMVSLIISCSNLTIDHVSRSHDAHNYNTQSEEIAREIVYEVNPRLWAMESQ